jgi:hypothetical protein
MILRRMPGTVNAWLRYQYGYMERRFENLARYERRHDERGLPYDQFIEFEVGKKPVEVFHLCGYGSTEAEAKAMAVRTLSKS